MARMAYMGMVGAWQGIASVLGHRRRKTNKIHKGHWVHKEKFL